jgi:hypothetical protein
MTLQEFKSYTRGMAYHVVKFERGEIDSDGLVEALRVQLGDEVFEEAESIMDKKKQNK